MKIRTTATEIECTANELRQSSTLSEGFYNLLRGCFKTSDCDEDDAEDKEEERIGEE